MPTTNIPACGPFESEAEARELPAVRAVYTAFRALTGPAVVGGMNAPNRTMLEDACSAAGVQLGAFDRRILTWLAGYEPETCAVVAGLIARAAAAARAGAR